MNPSVMNGFLMNRSGKSKQMWESVSMHLT